MMPDEKHRDVILRHVVSEAYHNLVQRGWDGKIVAAEFERLGTAQVKWFDNLNLQT